MAEAPSVISSVVAVVHRHSEPTPRAAPSNTASQLADRPAVPSDCAALFENVTTTLPPLASSCADTIDGGGVRAGTTKLPDTMYADGFAADDREWSTKDKTSPPDSESTL